MGCQVWGEAFFSKKKNIKVKGPRARKGAPCAVTSVIASVVRWDDDRADFLAVEGRVGLTLWVIAVRRRTGLETPDLG